ncbi:bifunctional folylpolyglutamate synthase/dihydrofolate synthase [Algoriphagus kandeliae]|uniref:Dihydrofolate synthase/folylpolyglutamate synthase n=1 Tax=Algoriphagus kandeliae TaxID=2562278 RepID=A0A4Y9R022_9BACT|nr:folylpolyglutamate synthase/dihydrofolate synthase family protein [Algoriphagus kandeliae]TFV97837.1 bifunctional folylpolyglutamate synthase/dihydrofolate synthase [Algoriphagus kandeliae]
MTYQETLDFLFNALPMFQRVGASAFKKDLSNTLALCEHLGNPQKEFKSVHIAGTNGKGSSSHALAAVLHQAGYKTGLYTSPHLKSFTERIRINGVEIPEDDVVLFVAENQDFLEELKPSFFEMTVAMAFWFFAKEKVDIAIIEVGMGGRLDSTNVINPELCLITNIGWDHMQYLGDTLPKIAAEKAGIIKENTPLIISQTQEECREVFIEKATEKHAPLVFADKKWRIKRIQEKETQNSSSKALYEIHHDGEVTQLRFGLLGDYQVWNIPGILESVSQLQQMDWKISKEAIEVGLSNISELTGLKGRWQILSSSPMIISDTGHNEPGIRAILSQLSKYDYDRLWMVIGMVNDKDVSKILALLPKNAKYIFCEAKIPRALPAEQLAEKAKEFDLQGEIISNIPEAIQYARKNAAPNDLIFIGGSTFVVAEIEEL